MSLRQVLLVAAVALLLLLFHRLKRHAGLLVLAVLPGTFAHELCHLIVGWLLRARPSGFSLWPRREGGKLVLGSVAFAHPRWYNVFFAGMAPLLLLPAAWFLLRWRLGGLPRLTWAEAGWAYLVANLLFAALPSWQDCKVAARSPIGWLLLAAAVAGFWWRYHAG